MTTPPNESRDKPDAPKEYSKGWVKTGSFEKTMVFLYTLSEETLRVMQNHKSFRMILDYNPEALNARFAFYELPKDDADCSKLEATP